MAQNVGPELDRRLSKEDLATGSPSPTSRVLQAYAGQDRQSMTPAISSITTLHQRHGQESAAEPQYCLLVSRDIYHVRPPAYGHRHSTGQNRQM